jgi:hypothetical protein
MTTPHKKIKPNKTENRTHSSSQQNEDGSWQPVIRHSRTVPFGYEADPENSKLLNPIPEQLDIIMEAKEHLKTCGYREVSRWITAKTGRPISHAGLAKIIKEESKRLHVSNLYRHYATQAQEWARLLSRIQENIIYIKEQDKKYVPDTEWADEVLARRNPSDLTLDDARGRGRSSGRSANDC